MKKLVSLLIAIIMIMGVVTAVYATSSSELADKLYEMGKPYGMTTANKVRIEKYLKQNPVTDEEADKLVAKMEAGIEIFKKAGVTKYSKLSDAQKEEIKSLAVEAGKIIDLTVKFEAKEAKIYKNGKLIEVANYDGDKFLYTGNNVNTILVVSAVGAIALIAGFALRKKFANA